MQPIPSDKSLKWRILIAKIYIIANSVGLLVSSLLFITGFLDWLWFSRQLVASAGGYLVALFVWKLPIGRIKYEPNRAMKLTCFFFILGGAMFTSIALFFVTGFLLMAILGARIPVGPIGNTYLIISFIGGPIIGSIIGFLIFKRSKYSNPSLYTSYQE